MYESNIICRLSRLLPTSSVLKCIQQQTEGLDLKRPGIARFQIRASLKRLLEVQYTKVGVALHKD